MSVTKPFDMEIAADPGSQVRLSRIVDRSMNLNSSVCRPGNPARHRAVENAPSPDETP
jgi:hypothetical protein